MSWKEVVIESFDWLWQKCIETPLYFAIGSIVIMLILFLLSHILDVKEGLFRNVFLLFAFFVLLCMMIVIVLISIDKGYIFG